MTPIALLGKLASGSASQADYQHFNDWFHALPESEQLQVIQQYEALLHQEEGVTLPAALAQKIAARVKAHEQQKKKAKVIRLARWSAVAAAAVAGIIWFTAQPKPQPEVSQNRITTTPVNDREPASPGATLTLADGSILVLDSTTNGSIAMQGQQQVNKTNGQISYTTTGGAAAQPLTTFNTLATARGRQFQLLLPDGSKVWLNAASSIRYPTSFAGAAERKVTITGEAYFEIARNASQPFKVQFRTPANGAGEVEVLGTHFNINAYADEPFINTTLLEGKIKIAPVDTSSTLPSPALQIKPGQQAALFRNKKNAPQIQLQEADAEGAIAWKNGRFRFNNASIKDIMRQVSRWYDVDIIYDKTIPEKAFTADLSRQTRLSELLKVLELSGFSFTIDAKTLTVKN